MQTDRSDQLPCCTADVSRTQGQYHITIKTPEGETSRFATFNYEDKNVIRIKLIERSTSEAEVREFTMDSSNQVAGR